MSQSPQTIGAYQIKPPTKRDLFSVSYWTQVVRRLNALILMEPARGEVDGPLMMTDARAILPLKSFASMRATAGGMHYLQEYDNAEAYVFGDMVRVTSGTSPPQGIWVCVTDQPAYGSAPELPETGNWELIARETGMRWRIAFDAGASYSEGDCVYTESTSLGVTTRQSWICEYDTTGAAHAPTWPEEASPTAGKVYWRLFAGFPELAPYDYHFKDTDTCDEYHMTILATTPVLV